MCLKLFWRNSRIFIFTFCLDKDKTLKKVMQKSECTGDKNKKVNLLHGYHKYLAEHQNNAPENDESEIDILLDVNFNIFSFNFCPWN